MSCYCYIVFIICLFSLLFKNILLLLRKAKHNQDFVVSREKLKLPVTFLILQKLPVTDVLFIKKVIPILFKKKSFG